MGLRIAWFYQTVSTELYLRSQCNLFSVGKKGGKIIEEFKVDICAMNNLAPLLRILKKFLLLVNEIYR